VHSTECGREVQYFGVFLIKKDAFSGFLFEKIPITVYLHSTESGRKVQNFGILVFFALLQHCALFCGPVWSFAVFSQTQKTCTVGSSIAVRIYYVIP